MKLRKTLALLVAFAMIASMVPALGLTASAAAGDAIVLADGKTALLQKSDNLIADGGFEDDAAWQDALTTGKFFTPGAGVVNFGKNGVDGISKMNRDTTVVAGALGNLFERVTPGVGGTGSAISVVLDKLSNGTSFVGANGPASIKHYIANDSSSAKTYYVSFYAKALVEAGANFRYYIDAIGANDAIPSDVSAAAVNDTEWTKIEKVVNVGAGQQLIINIFEMTKDTLALDEFFVCEAESNADSDTFAKAMEEWDSAFKYTNGQIISADMSLPTEVGGATVTWSSSKPEVIANDGKLEVPATNTSVELVAEIKVGNFKAYKTYMFNVIGFGKAISDVVKASLPSSIAGSMEFITTVPGYEGSSVTWSSSKPEVISNDGKYVAPAAITEVVLTATISYNGATFSNDYTVTAGTLVPNGGFINTGADALAGWTSRARGAISEAEVIYDETIGRNVLHMASVGGKSAKSIGTAWTVVPGMRYDLSFDLKVATAISSNNLRFNKISDTVGDADDANYTDIGGEIILDYGAEVRANEWVHFEKSFTANTDTVYFQASWTDDYRLANVILRPVKTDFTTEVTINYLDRQGNALKESRVVKNLDGTNDGTISYTAAATDKAIIEKDGVVYVYDNTSVDNIALKAEGNVIDLYFKVNTNLIINGDFETPPTDDTIYGWTTGVKDAEGTAPMTTATFKYMAEDNGNHYIRSNGHGGLKSADSIRTYISLEPNKVYSLSFKMWYHGAGASYEAYTGAYLVDSVGADGITDAATAIARKNATGGYIPDAGDMLKGITYADGWQTINTTLTTNSTYSTLLIAATWLNATGNGNATGYWAFDDFILKEIKSEFKGDITVNYISAEDKTTVLKPSRSESGLPGESEYHAVPSDKTDIEFEGETYFYDTTSVDYAEIAKETGNVINLYFKKLVAQSAETIKVDVVEGEEAVLPATVKVTYNNGAVKAEAVEWAELPELNAGDMITVGGVAAGVETEAEINVFFGGSKPEGYEDAVWVGNSKKYPAAEGAENLVPSGSFEDNSYASVWQAYNNGSLPISTAVWALDANNKYSGNSSLKNIAGVDGKNSASAIQTYFEITPGKKYLVSVMEYSSVKTDAGSNRMTAIVATDSIGNREGIISCGGFSSWYNEANKITPRDRGFGQGWHEKNVIIDTTNAENAKYIFVGYAWVGANELALDDFMIYEIQTDEAVYDASAVQVKLVENIDGVVTEKMINKGSALPNYANEFPGAAISVDGDTNKPVVNVTVTTGAPALKSSVAILGDKAVVYAVDEAVEGTVVIAQYAGNELVDVKSQAVSVEAGSTAEVAIVPAENATRVRAMVVDSLESLVPVVKAIGAVAGGYAPAVITPSDESQAHMGYYATSVFDGDTVDTRWTSQLYTQDNHCYLILDFGQEISVSDIDFVFNNNGRNTVFKLGVSSDGKVYETVFDGKSNEKTASVNVAGKTFRYVKYDGFGNDNAGDPKWTSINEIIVK